MSLQLEVMLARQRLTRARTAEAERKMAEAEARHEGFSVGRPVAQDDYTDR